MEGRLADIQIEGTEGLKPSYIRKRIQSATSTPLRIDTLEEQLRLLRTNPLFDTLNATLEAGDEVGESILVVQVEEAMGFLLWIWMIKEKTLKMRDFILV
ncbi:POTRA domain-containing protein [Coleofasciculus sp.]|uniref:POTRA domain-containing protein n=1 Tax=Coleofasciculus sp. TaxID=3100458 RepID=UPI0039F9B5A5